ncbi:MAG: hypothetical protein DRJ06_02305 [Candidatus Aminicenantes bacterium]|nr:MAG: hypothetical protein DRJ06_02305 [Candidatus Aminicenantes bacterium]
MTLLQNYIKYWLFLPSSNYSPSTLSNWPNFSALKLSPEQSRALRGSLSFSSKIGVTIRKMQSCIYPHGEYLQNRDGKMVTGTLFWLGSFS